MPGEATNQNGQVSACSDHQAPGACTRREGPGRGVVSPGVFVCPPSHRPPRGHAQPDPNPAPSHRGARPRWQTIAPTSWTGCGRNGRNRTATAKLVDKGPSWTGRPAGTVGLAQRGREPLAIRSVLASIPVAPGACIRCDGTTRDQGFSGRFRVPGSCAVSSDRDPGDDHGPWIICG